MWRFLTVLVVVGCSHHEAKPAQPVAATDPPKTEAAVPADDPAPCPQVAKHGRQISVTDDPTGVAEFYERHCREDAWSLDARKCMLLANTMDEGVACESKLTDAQMQSINNDAHAKWPGSSVAKPKPQP